MTRIYTTFGSATFYCAGHPVHRPGHRLGKHPLHGHKTVLDQRGNPVDGEQHHSITFVWVPGCVHIDDHDPKTHGTPAGEHVILRGCDHGCDQYHLVEGHDPYHPSNFEDISNAEQP